MKHRFHVFILIATIVTCISTLTCPDVESQANTITTKRHTISGYADFGYTRANYASSLGNIYIYGDAQPSGYMAFVKFDSSLTSQWAKVYQDTPCPLGFAISPNENDAYGLVLSGSLVKIVKLDSIDGSLSSEKSFSGYSTDSQSKVAVSSDSTVVYLTAVQDTTIYPTICRWEIITSDFECAAYDINNRFRAIIPLDGSNLVTTSEEDISAASLKFKRVDFSQTSNIAVWQKTIPCTDSSCPTNNVEGILMDGTLMDGTGKLAFAASYYNLILFVNLNATNGEPVDGKYTLDDSCTEARAISYNSDTVYYLVSCAFDYLLVYDYDGDQWLSYTKNADASITLKYFVMSTSFFYTIGTYTNSTNNFGHVETALLAGPDVSPNFESVTLTLTAQPSWFYQVLEDSTLIQTATNTTASDTSTITADGGASFAEDPTYTSNGDVSVWTDALSLTAVANETMNLDLSYLTCSISGGTTITFSLDNYEAESPPVWASVDGAAQELTVSPPDSQSQDTLMFTVVATIGAAEVSKTITLTVEPTGTVLSPEPEPEAEENQESSSPQNNQVEEISITIKTTKALTQTVIGVGLAAGVTTTLLVSSSPQSLWTLLNQFQMFLLLNLLNADLPENIKEFLKGFEFTTFGIDEISLDKISFIRKFFETFNCDEEDDGYNRVGINYTCAFINHSQLILGVFLLISCHFFINFLYKTLEGKQGCFPSIFKYLHKFWNLTVYVRVILEAYLFMVLSSFTEIYLAQCDTGPHVTSYIIAIIILGFCAIFILTLFLLWVKPPAEQSLETGHKLREVYEGVKRTRLSMLFQLVYVARRTFSAIWIVISKNMHANFRMPIYFVIQTVCFTYTVLARPLVAVQENLVEIVNEFVYVIVCSLLIHYNSKDRWTESASHAVIVLMTINGILIVTIQSIFLVLNLIKYLKKKKPAKPAKPAKVNDEMTISRDKMVHSGSRKDIPVEPFDTEQNKNCKLDRSVKSPTRSKSNVHVVRSSQCKRKKETGDSLSISNSFRHLNSNAGINPPFDQEMSVSKSQFGRNESGSMLDELEINTARKLSKFAKAAGSEIKQ